MRRYETKREHSPHQAPIITYRTHRPSLCYVLQCCLSPWRSASGHTIRESRGGPQGARLKQCGYPLDTPHVSKNGLLTLLLRTVLLWDRVEHVVEITLGGHRYRHLEADELLILSRQCHAVSQQRSPVVNKPSTFALKRPNCWAAKESNTRFKRVIENQSWPPGPATVIAY